MVSRRLRARDLRDGLSFLVVSATCNGELLKGLTLSAQRVIRRSVPMGAADTTFTDGPRGRGWTPLA